MSPTQLPPEAVKDLVELFKLLAEIDARRKS